MGSYHREVDYPERGFEFTARRGEEGRATRTALRLLQSVLCKETAASLTLVVNGIQPLSPLSAETNTAVPMLIKPECRYSSLARRLHRMLSLSWACLLTFQTIDAFRKLC